MPRIVQPEDEDTFGIARASGLHQELGSSGQGFVPGKVKTGRRRLRFSQLTRETEQLLKAVGYRAGVWRADLPN